MRLTALARQHTDARLVVASGILLGLLRLVDDFPALFVLPAYAIVEPDLRIIGIARGSETIRFAQARSLQESQDDRYGAR